MAKDKLKPSPAGPPAMPRPDIKNMDIPMLLGVYIQDIRTFSSAITVGFDPLDSNSYLYYIHQLLEGKSFVGSWLLRLLYGMLGAVIFHMRRLLDPTVPDPSWLRFAYRIVLGVFAGIILVWFWASSSQKASQPAFAMLTSFGLAFLVGFSTSRLWTVLSATCRAWSAPRRLGGLQSRRGYEFVAARVTYCLRSLRHRPVRLAELDA